MRPGIVFSFPLRQFSSFEEVYVEIYKKHYRDVVNNALAIYNCKTTSEDIAQDVFLRLWMNKEELKHIRDIENYLFVMTKHVALDRIRKNKNQKYFEQDYANHHLKTIIINDYEVKQVKCIANNAFEKLSLQQKKVYFLKREEGWSRNEIAQTLNISENTVKVTMQKALKTLRQNIGEAMVA